MKGKNLYLNILFFLAILSLHLPIWYNGKFASFLAILNTIVSSVLGLEDITTLSGIIFLLPIYVLYYFVFKIVGNRLIKVLLWIILFLAIIPFGSMLPPR